MTTANDRRRMDIASAERSVKWATEDVVKAARGVMAELPLSKTDLFIALERLDKAEAKLARVLTHSYFP